ncbi:MAG: spore germination protein, partial [Clostridia bacterium]
INEASVRVPGAMGSTLSIVGGLILGQTVVSADLVSPLSIIVVAISGLGAFAVPDYDMTMTLRILQLLFLIVAALSGLYGILALGFVLLAQLCGMSSMGMPLMEPVAPERMHNPDVLMRYPLWQQRIRNYLSNPG